jgi:hypothetical protein
MNCVRRQAIACTVLLLVSHRADAAFTVTPVLPLIADICETCAPPQVRLPIAFTGLPADAKIMVVVRDAVLNNKHDTEYHEAIGAAVVKSGDGGFELQISVKANSLREQGTYAVALEFSAPGQDAQRTTLQLLRTAAALQPPGTLIVERVLATPWGDSAGEGPPLKLLETSRRTGLSEIHLVSPNPIGPEYIAVTIPPGDCPDNQTSRVQAVTQPGAVLQVGPGQSRCLDYKAVGDFPWGPQVQAYSLRSPELAAPVPVTFDVRTRLHRAYVLFYILLGVLVSLVVKVVLQRRIDQGTARNLALELEEKVRADRAKHPDVLFQRALDDPLKALSNAVAADSVEAITAARTALDTAWRTAVTDLGTRRTSAQQLIDRLRAVAETDWDVPAAPREVIATVGSETTRSRELLAGERVSAAMETATAAAADASERMSAAIPAWQDAVVDLLTSIASSPMGLSPAVAGVATIAATEAKLRIGSTKLSPLASAEQLVAALVSMTDETRAARKSVRVVTLALEQELDRVAAKFGKPREQFGEMVASVSAVKQALGDAIDRPDVGHELARTALTPLDNAWRAAFESIGGKNLSKAVSDLLGQKRYDEAATTLAIELRGEADQARLAAQRGLLPAVAADVPTAPVRTFETRTPFGAEPPPLAALRARTRMEVAQAKLFQSAIVALLAVLVGYGLFAPKFVGDFQDFVIIFFWAFGLDLSADAIVRLAPTARR